MNPKQLWSRRRPHLWFQLYWVVYLIWFFWLDLTIKDPKYIIHAPFDDRIPFNEWFIFPYCSWFVLLAGVILPCCGGATPKATIALPDHVFRHDLLPDPVRICCPTVWISAPQWMRWAAATLQ